MGRNSPWAVGAGEAVAGDRDDVRATVVTARRRTASGRDLCETPRCELFPLLRCEKGPIGVHGDTASEAGLMLVKSRRGSVQR